MLALRSYNWWQFLFLLISEGFSLSVQCCLKAKPCPEHRGNPADVFREVSPLCVPKQGCRNDVGGD